MVLGLREVRDTPTVVAAAESNGPAAEIARFIPGLPRLLQEMGDDRAA